MTTYRVFAEKEGDAALAATLIARTYMDMGAKMIKMTGQLRGLPNADSKYGMMIANEKDEAVGYAMVTPLKVGDAENAALLLAPLAYDTFRDDVHPNDILEIVLGYAKDLGFRYVMMHADPEAHEGFGFVDADTMGISSDVRYPNSVLLVKDFGEGQPQAISGKVIYPPFVS